jgi:hypothetical protein
MATLKFFDNEILPKKCIFYVGHFWQMLDVTLGSSFLQFQKQNVPKVKAKV